jgi:archaeal cell division control protein 6
MSLFKDVLASGESLFKNPIALDYDYMPKIVPYREMQQKQVARSIQPLFQGRNGKNVLLFGSPGVGKTVAIKHVLKELEEQTDDIIPLYINCWQKNTSYKVFMELCEALDYRFTQNKKTDELFKVVASLVNKKSVVFVFDEIDKAEEYDFLYSILEEIYRKSVILITNYRGWIDVLDERIRSRLLPDIIEFPVYNPKETEGIMQQRQDYAFVPGIWDPKAFTSIVERTAQIHDMRTGLYLLREAGEHAESRSSKKIVEEDAKYAIQKLDQYSIKNSAELEPETHHILNIIKDNSGKKIGDLYKIYQEKGGSGAYKTFQRRIDKLELGKFIEVKKTEGGAEGNTSIITFKEVTKKLTEF